MKPKKGLRGHESRRGLHRVQLAEQEKETAAKEQKQRKGTTLILFVVTLAGTQWNVPHGFTHTASWSCFI